MKAYFVIKIFFMGSKNHTFDPLLLFIMSRYLFFYHFDRNLCVAYGTTMNTIEPICRKLRRLFCNNLEQFG